jgi:lipid-A-disaccharide synthase
MSALKKLHPQIQFEGIGGSMMQAQGLQSWYPLEKLSVMGLVEVLKHLPELLRIRKDLVKRWLTAPPDIFIGVDAPDFNLGLEAKLKQAGIPTVHYVCPTIWAWRENRVKKIKKAVNLVLSIFPFEVPLLASHQVKAHYAGHPLAQALQEVPDQKDTQKKLGLDSKKLVLGILPGSRMSEVTRLTDDFLEAATILKRELPDLQVIAPMATPAIYQYVESKITEHSLNDINLLDGQSRDVMAASDILLTASGTATLETMLYKKPMVVAYKVHWLSYFIFIKLGLLKTKYFAMPNILAGKLVVPELMQDDCTPENLADAVLQMIDNDKSKVSLASEFEQIHQDLAKGSIETAARELLNLID